MAGKDKKTKKGSEEGQAVAPPRLFLRYREEIRTKLREQFGFKNDFSIPCLQKIVLNMGVGQSDDRNKRMEAAQKDLACSSGQRPIRTIARQSVAGFRLREGMPIGCKVTLRGKRMYEFLDRLVSVAMPRIRDFQGLNPKSFDGNGNYSMGVEDQSVFPEIDLDNLQYSQGMDITLVNTATSDEQGRALLESFGMPFAEKS